VSRDACRSNSSWETRAKEGHKSPPQHGVEIDELKVGVEQSTQK
jgi:hypothetical protein